MFTRTLMFMYTYFIPVYNTNIYFNIYFTDLLKNRKMRSVIIKDVYFIFNMQLL